MLEYPRSSCLQNVQYPPKAQWKSLIKTKITAFHESDLRKKALGSVSLQYFNVQLLGLTGKPHASILSAQDIQSVEKLRIHLKFLTGDFLRYAKLARDQGCGSHCRLCSAPIEHTQHILTECRGTSEVRERLYPELVNLVADIAPQSSLLDQSATQDCLLTQFILDPASLNLPNSIIFNSTSHEARY